MSSGYLRVVSMVMLHFMIMSLVPSRAPSNPISFDEAVPDAPDAAEIELFEELVEWIGEDDLGAAAGREPLRQTIRSRPASFDVFRSYHDDSTRHRRLHEIPYGHEVRQAAGRFGVDGLLIASIMEVESSFDPCAVSDRGAVGLMQVMPATAGDVPRHRLTDPETNLEIGTRYLRHLLKLYDGDLELALAAYNAGPANVRRYGGLPPFRETRRYVEKVLGRYVAYHQEVWRESETGELLISEIPPASTFEVVGG